MAKAEPVYFVTNDKWMRLPGGKLDKDDRRAMMSMGKNIEVINFAQMCDRMQKETPEKFEQFRKEMSAQKFKNGRVLTVPEIYELGAMANEAKKQFDWLANLMHVEWAQRIRKWRLEEHLTWRSIARRAFNDSNQLLGLALCERAARMCNEDYLLDPWN
jgi:hypothetical protein